MSGRALKSLAELVYFDLKAELEGADLDICARVIEDTGLILVTQETGEKVLLERES